MKHLLILIFISITLNLAAQNAIVNTDGGFVVLKGHIKNSNINTWDLSTAEYLKYSTISMVVDKNGDFSKRLPITGYYEDAFLRIANGVPIFFKNNDTLEINWDANDIEKSLTIKASKTDRNHDIQTQFILSKLYANDFYKLNESLYSIPRLTDSVMFSKINTLYNQEIETLLKEGVYINTEKMVMDIYFKYTGLLRAHRLLPAYELTLLYPSTNSNLIALLKDKKAYQTESEINYRSSSAYRDFLFDYVRFATPITSWSTENNNSKTINPSYSRQDYYIGLINFHITEIRDWFITKSIMFGFANYSFDETSAVYKDFITKVETPYYADTLKRFYANVQRLKPGSPAPEFKLKNEAGQLISLAGFKGKTLYIDFWGVGCGPCIYDIKNNVPALHEKYKDKNIVFINICVDSNEEGWKAKLKELNLHGVNLIAEGWVKNPMVAAYGVNGIPHYYLVDPAGKIVDNNSPGPGESGNLYPKIDKLLQ